MRRLALTPAHRRLALQLALLGGIGLAFLAQRDPVAVAGGGGGCFEENECTFKKPNFMIVLDYSSSMSEPFGMGQTRWEVAVGAITSLMTTNGGYFQENMHVALMRYGHDPDPDGDGTTIPMDMSGIVDGQALDVNWYDPESPDKTYFECNGQDIISSLNATPPPLCPNGPGNCSGIGTWTKGALDHAKVVIGQAKVDHPEDVVPGQERFYGLMVVTDGAWTSQVGFPQLDPPQDNPSLTASDLYDNQGIPTYVIAVADAADLEFADELAAAGGTTESIAADNPPELFAAIGQVVQDIADQVIVPECTAGLPRVMVLLDASSSMLNVGDLPGEPGETGWDRARSALASGNNSLFDVEVDNVGRPVEDLIHLGLTVFGGDAPAEEKVLVQYGPCMQDNFGWALDPSTSCEMPGCSDPWGGPSITWTFKDGSQVPPFFDQSTRSHMPACLPSGLGICQGSGTYTHRGLDLVFDNLLAYQVNPPDIYPTDDTTQYVNVLITDGQYSGYSTDAQVQGALEVMFDAGVKTYVIGFGDGLNTPEAQQQLANMASWGSGGQNNFFDADTQAELETALGSIIEGISFDPCCAFNDCSENPEPTTEEPDPGMGTTFTSSTTNGDGTSDGWDTDGDGTSDGWGTADDTSTGWDTDGDGTSDSGWDTDGDGTSDGWDTDGDGTSDWGEDNADGWDDGPDGGTAGDESGTAGFGFGNDAGLNGRGCNCDVNSNQGPWAPLAFLGFGLLGLASTLRRRDRE
ncbi:von Willebrand factor type A domain protein [Enhygromyxa salina]|uniref:von Willebrand factor type A domain protein n=1 Tax=Enhygromyxa salina TaxID=215803 RepID=A0A2S9XHU0_9BACT|nr:MYXO-CTERM sorting domain-containing protein [Enhygromyxa salina]PRP92300.1 von Willebrand factor type A domain protein [Enhygromyxa salina]